MSDSLELDNKSWKPSHDVVSCIICRHDATNHGPEGKDIELSAGRFHLYCSACKERSIRTSQQIADKLRLRSTPEPYLAENS